MCLRISVCVWGWWGEGWGEGKKGSNRPASEFKLKVFSKSYNLFIQNLAPTLLCKYAYVCRVNERGAERVRMAQIEPASAFIN